MAEKIYVYIKTITMFESIGHFGVQSGLQSYVTLHDTSYVQSGAVICQLCDLKLVEHVTSSCL